MRPVRFRKSTLRLGRQSTGDASRQRAAMAAVCGFSGSVAQTHQSVCDPGATDLVFFAELTQTASADDGDASVTSGQVGGQDRVATEAGEIGGETGRGFVNDLGAGGGDQDEGPVDIDASGEFRGAVVQFESGRHLPTGLAGQQGSIELRGEFHGGLHGGRGETAASGGHCGDRRGGGADDIDCDDCPTLPVTGDAFRQIINYDRFAHSVDHPFVWGVSRKMQSSHHDV